MGNALDNLAQLVRLIFRGLPSSLRSALFKDLASN
jgi:hypothetical protein